MRSIGRAVLSLSTVAALALGSVAAFAPASSGTVAYPTLVGVRYAKHTGFDRVVFDFTGGTPSSWTTAYGTLVGEGTGTPIPVAGEATLVLRMEFARAHDDSGAATYPITKTLDPNLPALRQVKFGGDYEGYVTAGLGLRDRVAYKVFALSGPPRLVVDVTHPAPFRTTAASKAGTLSNVTVSGVRSGRHYGYDRLVFDVRGTALPAYAVRYSGDTSVLVVRLSGPGTARYLGATPVWIGLPGLRSARLVSSTGGALVFRVGTAQRHGFRVSLLRSPTRLVVDVKH